jgi:hypothetical protein
MVANITLMYTALSFYVIAIFERDSREVRCSGILHSIYVQLGTDVSGQPVGPFFKGQPVQARLGLFICFVFISEQKATSAPYNIN